LLADIKSARYEIIVIDNASSDDSSQALKLKYPQIKLIDNTENTGFAKANNQSILLAQGEFILLLNPDTQRIDAETRSKILEMIESKGLEVVAELADEERGDEDG